jgi:hypothetical protein
MLKTLKLYQSTEYFNLNSEIRITDFILLKIFILDVRFCVTGNIKIHITYDQTDETVD